MYTILWMALIAAAVAVIVWGAKRQSVLRVVCGVLLGAATAGFFWLLGFWGELLWFDALGQAGRFWRGIGWQVGCTIGGGLGAALAAWLLTLSFRGRWGLRGVTIAAAFLVGLTWGWDNWQTVALYVNQAPTELSEPIFDRPVGFYMFSLPLYHSVRSLGLLVSAVCLIASLAGLYARVESGTVAIFAPGGPDRGPSNQAAGPPAAGMGSMHASAAALLALWALGAWLNRYDLLYSRWGAVTGAGWTDIHARLPGYWIALVAGLVLAAVLAVGPLRRKLLEAPIRKGLDRSRLPRQAAGAGAVVAAVVLVLLVRLVVLVFVPGLLQWLRVEPNEITFEKPYIRHNIRFTRHGFGLADAEDREFPATGELSTETVRDNQAMFDNIRLWDYRALSQVYSQFQELRLYYEFADVDIDRYMLDGRYRQVMISARELKLSNLPSGSQTFVNRHFKYTHGNGITLATVSDFTPQGLPNLLIKDIPPVSVGDAPKVDQPRIYYGELTDTYAVTNSEEEEFDYPSGRRNVYSHYDGTGGVRLGGLWRKFLFGWKFGGTRLLLSGYPTADSRIMFRRNIRDRVRALAPFLHFDRDPYIVLANGRLHWILDAYTTSSRYPYSEPFDVRGLGDSWRRRPSTGARELSHLHGVNYVRNSVKAVIDAYNGNVTLFVMDPNDPVIRTWQGVFPDLFRPREQMPEDLFDHVRYPADMLLTQGLVYGKYHMTDPEVFYNLEDLWVRATEKYYQAVQPVEPYYIMWRPPDSDSLEYILMLPFTPKNKQVMIGWIAGMCDGENYGRFLAYRFPKERRLIGPQQIETKIDQDPHLSGQLTLWDQRGSKVIRGNVLAIPVAGTLLYVEPIYIQAETAAYPELRLVVTMHNDRLTYAETFEKALAALLGEAEPTTLPAARTRPAAADGTTAELIRRAGKAFDDYLRLTGEKRFDDASAALTRLENALNALADRNRTEDANAPAP